jgi:parallel beta-helix repeat protein
MNYSKLFLAITALLITTNSSALHYQHAIKIDNAFVKTKGTVITGDYEGTVTEPAITITTSAPIIIENAHLKGPGDLILASNANLIVRNTTGISTNPNIVGTAKGMFLHLNNPINLRVENCDITGSSFAVFIGGYGGNHTSSQTIKILHNIIRDIDGRPSDGNGGYLNTSGPNNAYGIQIIYANNLSGAEIAWNEVENDFNNSSELGTLQIFDTSGIALSHFLIHDNFFRGTYGSASIVFSSIGSDTASSVPAFVDVYNNQIVNSANYGIALTSGHDNAVFNNRVISSGYTKEGKFIAGPSAIGLVNANLSNLPPTIFFNNTIHDNLAGFISSNGRSDWSLPGQNNNVENNIAWQPIDNVHPTIEDENHEYQLWQQKVGSRHIKLGTS